MAEVRGWGDFRERLKALLERQTGHGLDHWNTRIAAARPADEAALRAWLAAEGVAGYPRMLLVMERFGYPDFMSASADALVEAQYARRPGLRPLYDALVAAALDLGDVVVQARKTYVSLLTPRRTFARVQAARDRIDVALRLDAPAGGRLARSRIHDTMPVQFSLAAPEDLDAEAVGLLKRAYDENA